MNKKSKKIVLELTTDEADMLGGILDVVCGGLQELIPDAEHICISYKKL